MDYPGRIALVLFTSGCNFDCSYCHNPELKEMQEGTLAGETALAEITQRKAIIDAVVITGGEPTLHGEDLVSFISALKKSFPAMLLKLDTNGSDPGFLEKVIGAVDMVAVDLKSLEYKSFSAVELDTVLYSIRIAAGFPEHEIRITMFPDYVDASQPDDYCTILNSSSVVAIQQCYLNGKPQCDKQMLEEFCEGLRRCVGEVRLRL